MFRVDGQVERTYHIWLPPGPVAAGYAVEACWVPPTTTPVVDPLIDFPISANQEEPYFFRHIVNGDEPITYEPCCGSKRDCTDLCIEFSKWYDETPRTASIYFHPWPDWMKCDYSGLQDCDCDAPPDVRCLLPAGYIITEFYEDDGNYRGVAVMYRAYPDPSGVGWAYCSFSYDVFDYTIDLD